MAAREEGVKREKFVAGVVAAAVSDIEVDLQTTLGSEKRADVEEFVRMVLASGLDVSEPW